VKHLATFLSVVALILAVGMMFRLRVHGVLWAPAAYLIVQCSCALVVWWVVQTQSLESKVYAALAAWLFGAVLVAVVSNTLLFAFSLFSLGDALFLVVDLVGLSSFLIHVVLGRLKLFYSDGVPHQLQTAVIQGGLIFGCGVIALVCLFVPMKPELQRVVTALGGFWFSIGLFMLLWPIGFTRNVRVWLTLNDFLPSLLAIAAFSWLTWQLSNLQSERVLEPLPTSQQISLHVPVVNFKTEREGRFG